MLKLKKHGYGQFNRMPSLAFRREQIYPTINYKSWLGQLFCKHKNVHTNRAYHCVHFPGGCAKIQPVVVKWQCKDCGRILYHDQRDWVNNP